jgi:hypothetical protein
MLAHSGPVLALLVLLALAGFQKLTDPSPTSGALSAAGLPSSRGIVLALGASELTLGTAAIVLGGRWLPLAAAFLYLGFAAFVANALAKKLPIRSCGCFGAVDTPPGKIHLIVNVLAAGVLAIAFFEPIDFVAQLTAAELGEAVAFLVLTAAAVYLLYALLAVLPLASAARREAPVQFVLSRPEVRG